MDAKKKIEEEKEVSIPYSTIKIACIRSKLYFAYLVSIPYSTIKIFPFLPFPLSARVSIPYSTIKISTKTIITF